MKVTVDVNKSDLDYFITKYGVEDYQKAVEWMVALQIKESRSRDK